MNSKTKIALLLSVVLAALLTALAIYLTPLKHLNIIEPVPKDVDPALFWADFQKNPDAYVFIDVRAADAYETAHAKGSVSQPIGSLFDGHHALPKRGKKIVLICSSGRLAGVGYGYLQNQGFLNLLRIEGGLQGWAVKGLPLEGKNIEAPLPTMD